jgi:protein TonB
MATANKGSALREGRAPIRDRLLAMAFLAALVHALVILGLTFGSDREQGNAPGLQVLLVSDELPEADSNDTATYLAQRTQLGSGNTQEQVAPHNRPSAPSMPQQAGTLDGEALDAKGSRAGTKEERVLTTTGWNTDVRYLADYGDTGSAKQRPVLLEKQSADQPVPDNDSGEAALRGPKRDELWVTPDTRAATLAPYLDAWRQKVERIGTINYPIAARHSRVRGSPVIEVGITADGTLDKVLIRHSSGDLELDQAALAVLKLASPFDPFPPDLAQQYRVLRFVYEWRFTGGGRPAGGTLSTLP